MTTSVKMRPEDKAALDRLQAEITARTGRKVTQQELMARLVDLGRGHLDELIDDDAPPSKEEIARARRRLKALPSDWGFETSHEAIDEELYGRGKG